jgi:hypothetical protein
MSWKETDKMDEKKEFIFRCRNREETFTEVWNKYEDRLQVAFTF